VLPGMMFWMRLLIGLNCWQSNHPVLIPSTD